MRYSVLFHTNILRLIFSSLSLSLMHCVRHKQYSYTLHSPLDLLVHFFTLAISDKDGEAIEAANQNLFINYINRDNKNAILIKIFYKLRQFRPKTAIFMHSSPPSPCTCRKGQKKKTKTFQSADGDFFCSWSSCHRTSFRRINYARKCFGAKD